MKSPSRLYRSSAYVSSAVGGSVSRTHLINTPPATKGRTFRKHRLSKKARKGHLQCFEVGAISILTIYEMASSVYFEDYRTRNRVNSRTGNHGGLRGRIKGFSRVSRRNLLRRLASINRTAFNAFNGRLISVTLTYPAEYPQDPEVCKGHLKALRKRLQRKYGRFAAFWRMGIQRRSAWPRRRSSPKARRREGSGGYGMKVCSLSSGRQPGSASGMPTKFGESIGGWRD